MSEKTIGLTYEMAQAGLAVFRNAPMGTHDVDRIARAYRAMAALATPPVPAGEVGDVLTKLSNWLAYVKDEAPWAPEPEIEEFERILDLARSAISLMLKEQGK